MAAVTAQVVVRPHCGGGHRPNMFSLLLALSSTLLLLPPARAAPALPSDCFLCRCPRNMQYQVSLAQL